MSAKAIERTEKVGKIEYEVYDVTAARWGSVPQLLQRLYMFLDVLTFCFVASLNVRVGPLDEFLFDDLVTNI